MEDRTKRSRASAERAYRDGLWVLEALEDAGYLARFAGGSVRDRILGRIPKDYDVATNALPEQVCSIFEQKSAKVVPTGVDHGTMTVLVRHSPIEVTTLRRDVSTNGRHASVEFGQSFEEDALRRDFTINAMFEDRAGKIYDYFGGRDDIKKRRLHFVGDADARIREDFLRILRLFRFWARLGFQPEAETLHVITRLAPGLQKISQERITSEILATLAGDDPLPPLQAMLDCCIFAQILPGISRLPTGILQNVLAQQLPAQEREICLLAVLIQAIEPLPDLIELGSKLRLSKRIVEKLSLILSPSLVFPEQSRSDGELMEWIDQWELKGGDGYTLNILTKIWTSMFPEHTELTQRITKLEEIHGGLRRQVVPLTGHHLTKELHLPAGPAIGETLKKLRIAFRNRQWQTAADGIALAKSWTG